MKKNGKNSERNSIVWLLVLISISLILIYPGSAAGVNIQVPTVNQGTHVFIGESGLDITNALIDPNTASGVNYVGWWRSVAEVGTTPADRYITIAPGSENNYFVNPIEYTLNGQIMEGAFYLCDQGSGMPIFFGGQPVVACYVAIPHIELVPADDVCPDINRTGQIFLGTNLNFNIKTNLYHIQNRPGGTNAGIFDINVLGPNGKDYKSLLGPDAMGCNCPACNPNNPVISIKDINILTNTHQWKTWDTDAVDPTTGLLYTSEGPYSISVTCWANNVIDNYVTAGGAKSLTISVNLVPESVTVTVNPGTILRTGTSTATVIGKPQTDYIIALMECPLKMTGEACDHPPWFVKDPLNPALQFDPVGGPYPIGSKVVYPSCCDGLTFRDVVPTLDNNGIYTDGVLYYANITTDCNGTATIDIDVDNTVWKADDNPVFTIHVQKLDPECNGVHLFAETELTVQKGDISIQISQASDTANTPISEAYLGDTLKIAGSNSDSLLTYLYMTGPCQPECGGGLIPVPYPHGPIGEGPEIVNVSVPAIEGFDWMFANPDSGSPRYWETKYLPMNPGTYTIWAITNWPPNCPNCLDCGGHPCFTNPLECPGCNGKVCAIEDCPNCDVYAVATIELKAPELTAITEDIERCCCPGYPCGTTIDGQPLMVSGISTGNPEKELNVWLLGKGKIGDVKFMNIKVPVNCDGTYIFDVVKDILGVYGVPLCRIDSGTYDLIIQDSGYNHQYDVIYEDDLDPTIWARPVEVNKKWILSGYPDIGPVENYSVTYNRTSNPNNDFLTHAEGTYDNLVPDPDSQRFYDDDWRKLVQVEGPGYKLGTEVLYSLIKGLDDPSVDDNYVHIQFTVSDKSCLVGTDFDADRTYGNKPLTIRFTDKSFQATSWLWDFGDGTTSTEQNPIHTFTEEGRYTISLTTNGDDKGKAVKNDYIRVAKGPTAKFVFAPKDVTVGIEVQFTDLSSGNPTSWLWQFGDGSSSPLQSPVYTYLTPGVYTVMLTVSDENGISSDSATQIITVQGSSTPVVADFKTEVTNGTNVQFIDLSSGFGIISWVWDFGDGSTSTERNPKHTYLKEGTYKVSLTVSNESFENFVQKTIGIR